METWRQQFEDNFFGAVLGTKACLPDMIAAGGGSVVVVSSVNGWMAEQGLIAYSCTKATLIEFARSLAVDHARQGIRANVVAPGATDTPAFRRAMGTAEDPEAWIAERAARNPLGRILSADEVANVVWFLASDEAAGMTGAVVAVDAGLSVSFDFRDPRRPRATARPARDRAARCIRCPADRSGLLPGSLSGPGGHPRGHTAVLERGLGRLGGDASRRRLRVAQAPAAVLQRGTLQRVSGAAAG